MEKMGLRFPAGKKTAFVTALLTLPALFAGCTNLPTGASAASKPPSGLSHPPAALFEAPVTLADPGSQELNQNLAPVIQGPAQAGRVSFNATQFVVKQSAEQRGDAKSQTTPRRVEHVNDHSFEQTVLDSDQAVLVDFYADWCAPCKKLSPVLDELARQMPSIRFVKVNIDRSPGSARSYRVKSLPTLILFKGGKPVARRGGLLSRDSLKKLVAGGSP
jgi:thioredoxin 1